MCPKLLDPRYWCGGGIEKKSEKRPGSSRSYFTQKSSADLKFEAEIKRLEKEREERIRSAKLTDERIHVRQTGPVLQKDGTSTGQWTTSAVAPDDRVDEVRNRLPSDATVIGKTQVSKI